MTFQPFIRLFHKHHRLMVTLSAVVLILLSSAVFTLLLWVTPLRHYLPGYNGSLHEQLALANYRVDSLQQQIDLQRTYVNLIRAAIAGDVQVDSVPSLDSLDILRQEELLMRTFPRTEAFVEEYERKMHDGLLEITQSASSLDQAFCTPVHGTVVEAFSPRDERYGILVQLLTDRTVSAILSGTVVYAGQVHGEGWTLLLQHEGDYLSVYRGLDEVYMPMGSVVQTGETLGLFGKEWLLQFELWQQGTPLNPEDMIEF